MSHWRNNGGVVKACGGSMSVFVVAIMVRVCVLE